MEIQRALLDLLLPRTHGRGFLTLEFPFRPLPEHEMWQADAAFVAAARWDAMPPEFCAGAPDLLVEILSAGEGLDDLPDRCETCLASGCRAYWTVDPKRRVVQVTGADGRNATFDSSAALPLPVPLEGTIPVSEIFPR